MPPILCRPIDRFDSATEGSRRGSRDASSREDTHLSPACPLPLSLPTRNTRRSADLQLRAAESRLQSPGTFLAAGPITDAVNLGTVALHAGRKVLFDSENMKITDVVEANKYLRREYREGWEF